MSSPNGLTPASGQAVVASHLGCGGVVSVSLTSAGLVEMLGRDLDVVSLSVVDQAGWHERRDPWCVCDEEDNDG